MKKRRFSEIGLFIKTVYKNYKEDADGIPKKEKLKCYLRMLWMVLVSLGNFITAPIIYPIWYVFRKSITEKIHLGTSWEEVHKLLRTGGQYKVNKLIKKNGWFLYWLWTYGDDNDPLGWGGMPKDYRIGKNTFPNRFMYSAIRNPRFTYNHLNFTSGLIVVQKVVKDTQDIKLKHVSYGIGDSYDGVLFKWMKEYITNRYHFIYEEANVSHIFYFGYVNTTDSESIGRFEFAYRTTKSSY